MKIGLISEEFPEETNFGGIATYHWTLAHALAEKGHQVFVFCRTFQKSHILTKGNITEIRIEGLFRSSSFWFDLIGYRISVLYWILRAFIRYGVLDVIEIAEWKAEGIFYVLFAKWVFRSKVLVKLHTPLVICKDLNSLPNNVINNFQMRCEKTIIRKADAVYSCSSMLRNKLIRMHYCPQSTKVVHNVPNIYGFQRLKHQYYITNEIKENVYKINGVTDILFAGSHEKRKGIDVVMKTFQKLCQDTEDVRLILCGAYGSTFNANSKLTKDEILSYLSSEYHGKVVFLGKKSYKEMKQIYSFADIGFFPSIFDNYPGVVLEALLCELPSIGSKNTGITEVCVDQRDIVFCDPLSIQDAYEKVRALIHDPNRSLMGFRGHIAVLKTFHTCLQKTLDLYQS